MNVGWYQSSLTNSSGGAITENALTKSAVNLLFPAVMENNPSANTTIRWSITAELEIALP